ncbi:IS3 family transposase [Nocardioides rotundus]|nr:IS3 family transposase [Nocardioides rotundus]
MDSVAEEHGGVQPVLAALEGTSAQIASSTYYAHKSRPASARSVRDGQLTEQIRKVHEDNMEVYGARKVWHEMNRQAAATPGQQPVARCTVERLMRAAGLRGVLRDKHPRTTRPAAETDRPADLVDRDFTAARPNQLWVADLTYVRTMSGWVYAAFVLDAYSRMIVGWQVATNLYTDLALDALQMGLGRRQRAGEDLTGLVHHSDRGVQYRAIRYSQRLAEADAVASVGSKGDSYDCEKNQGLPGRGLTLAYDWPRCLGVDLSAPARWRSTHTPAGREGGDRIGA